MSEEKKLRTVKYSLDLDEEDFIIAFTDKKDGKKKYFRLVTSAGFIEYRTPTGKRVLRVALVEVK